MKLHFFFKQINSVGQEKIFFKDVSISLNSFHDNWIQNIQLSAWFREKEKRFFTYNTNEHQTAKTLVN